MMVVTAIFLLLALGVFGIIKKREREDRKSDDLDIDPLALDRMKHERIMRDYGRKVKNAQWAEHVARSAGVKNAGLSVRPPPPKWPPS